MVVESLNLNIRTLKRLIEMVPAIVTIYREKIVYANPFTSEISGYSLLEMKDKYIWEFFPENYIEGIKRNLKLRLEGRINKLRYERIPIVTKNGEIKYIKFVTRSIRLNGEIYGLAVGIDISKEVELESRLRNYLKKIESILKYSNDIIMIIDQNGIVRYVSPSMENICGVAPESVIGKSAFLNIHPDDIGKLKDILELTFKNPGKTNSFEFRVIRENGSMKWVEGIIHLPKNWKEIGLEGAIVNERDITERKELELKIQRALYYDILTGLPNKNFFEEKLSYILKIAKSNKKLIAVVQLNIHKFRDINLAYGRETGDKILKRIKRRLKKLCSEAVIISRFFADNFGLLILIDRLEDIDNIISKLKKAFEKPFKINGNDIIIRCCIGVAIYPIDGENPEEILKKSEIALSKAKEDNDTDVSFYSKEIEEFILEREVVKNSLLSAIRDEQIVVYYQPIFDLRKINIIGFEALVRWNHPELGIIQPDKFIPIAEETGIIIDLGFYILKRSMHDVMWISRRFSKDFYLSVNFSARQFLERNLISSIENCCREAGLKHSYFVLEITERTAMKNPETTKRILKELKDLGIKLAIDDFGKGYSSMEYLIEFDVDILKIDKTFVLNMLSNEKAYHIVSTIINLAHTTGSEALAEGIETKAQFNALLDLSCDKGQGFFFAKPMPFENLVSFLKKIF